MHDTNDRQAESLPQVMATDSIKSESEVAANNIDQGVASETDREPDQESDQEPNTLEEQIVAALKTVYDPEIPVDIYELGLIYDIDVDEAGHVDVAMTLTAPGCPVAGLMPEWVREAVEDVPGVDSAQVEMVWEPPWTPDMMSMRAKLELNMF